MVAAANAGLLDQEVFKRGAAMRQYSSTRPMAPVYSPRGMTWPMRVISVSWAGIPQW
jgi:hypothetical protein